MPDEVLLGVHAGQPVRDAQAGGDLPPLAQEVGQVAAEVRAVYDEHHHGSGEGPIWMTLTVGVLAVLAVVGGWIQFAGLWHPLSDFLDGSLFVEREEGHHLSLLAEPNVATLARELENALEGSSLRASEAPG